MNRALAAMLSSTFNTRLADQMVHLGAYPEDISPEQWDDEHVDVGQRSIDTTQTQVTLSGEHSQAPLFHVPL